MNKDNAKDYLPLVQALADGKVIQGYFHLDEKWRDLVEMRFDADASDYRIKPEPREIWVNHYPRQTLFGGLYLSKEDADRYAGDGATQVRYREVIE